MRRGRHSSDSFCVVATEGNARVAIQSSRLAQMSTLPPSVLDSQGEGIAAYRRAFDPRLTPGPDTRNPNNHTPPLRHRTWFPASFSADDPETQSTWEINSSAVI